MYLKNVINREVEGISHVQKEQAFTSSLKFGSTTEIIYHSTSRVV